MMHLKARALAHHRKRIVIMISLIYGHAPVVRYIDPTNFPRWYVMHPTAVAVGIAPELWTLRPYQVMRPELLMALTHHWGVLPPWC